MTKVMSRNIHRWSITQIAMKGEEEIYLFDYWSFTEALTEVEEEVYLFDLAQHCAGDNWQGTKKSLRREVGLRATQPSPLSL